MAQVMTSQWLMSVGNKLTRPSIRFGGAWAYGTLAGRSSHTCAGAAWG